MAAGAKLWLVRPLGFCVDDRHLRRAGLDYWQHLDWDVVDDWDALAGKLPDRRPWLFSKLATKAYTSAAFQRGDVLVFGRETEGLTESMLAANADRSLRIPMRPRARSLNLANAVAVVAFEALRQMACVAEPSGH